jgi:hypothetical protein
MQIQSATTAKYFEVAPGILQTVLQFNGGSNLEFWLHRNFNLVKVKHLLYGNRPIGVHLRNTDM